MLNHKLQSPLRCSSNRTSLRSVCLLTAILALGAQPNLSFGQVASSPPATFDDLIAPPQPGSTHRSVESELGGLDTYHSFSNQPSAVRATVSGFDVDYGDSVIPFQSNADSFQSNSQRKRVAAGDPFFNYQPAFLDHAGHGRNSLPNLIKKRDWLEHLAKIVQSDFHEKMREVEDYKESREKLVDSLRLTIPAHQAQAFLQNLEMRKLEDDLLLNSKRGRMEAIRDVLEQAGKQAPQPSPEDRMRRANLRVQVEQQRDTLNELFSAHHAGVIPQAGLSEAKIKFESAAAKLKILEEKMHGARRAASPYEAQLAHELKVLSIDIAEMEARRAHVEELTNRLRSQRGELEELGEIDRRIPRIEQHRNKSEDQLRRLEQYQALLELDIALLEKTTKEPEQDKDQPQGDGFHKDSSQKKQAK